MKLLKDSRGISLIELVVSIALTGIVAAMAVQFYSDYNKQIKAAEQKLDYRIDNLLADKVLLRDFNGGLPSINNLRVVDLNGHNFYDYDPDLSGNLYRMSTHKFRARTLSFQPNANKDHFLLVHDAERGDPFFAEPVYAYQVGLPPSINEPAPLTFLGFQEMLSTQRPGILTQGQLVFVDSFSHMAVSAANLAPRPAAFFGVMGENGVIGLPTELSSFFDFRIFTPNGAVATNNIDTFLRNLPPQGASGSSIRIMPVRLYRYRLVCNDPDPKRCQLNRSWWVGGPENDGFNQGRTIMHDVSAVTFFRQSISNTVFSVSFNYYKKSTNTTESPSQ